MKRVRALPAEPPLLAEYRKTDPKEERRPASEAAAVWELFKAHKSAYEQLLDALAQAQQGLCIYCEQRLVDKNGTRVALDYQVEHVQPKSGTVGRVLDWTNLALACAGANYPHHPEPSRQFTNKLNTSCGQTKGDAELPASGDPRSLPLVDAVVEVGMDGKLSVNAQSCVMAGVSAQDLETALAVLNLNCERLRKARQDRRDNINGWIVPLLAELLAPSHLGDADRKHMLDLLIAGRLQPDKLGYLREFWTTERCALGPGAEVWIENNQGLFG
jgi:uncharacterized protein (TIGR02646 family)